MDAAGAKAALLAREGHGPTFVAVRTTQPEKTVSEHTAFQIRPQFSLNVKWERMLAGAHALEKGFQVIDQDPIEEMVLGCSPLVGMGWVVKRGGHGADGIATCIPSKAVVDPGDAATLYALTRRKNNAQFIYKIENSLHNSQRKRR